MALSLLPLTSLVRENCRNSGCLGKWEAAWCALRAHLVFMAIMFNSAPSQKGPFYSPMSVQIPVGPGSYLLKHATSKILFYISSEGTYTRGSKTFITMKVRGKAGFGLRGLLLSVFLSYLPPAVLWERKCLKKT